MIFVTSGKRIELKVFSKISIKAAKAGETLLLPDFLKTQIVSHAKS